MVPLWDLLNHVTGKCNVRLHHHAKAECLQMIATAPIAQGEELVNDYGDLSNGELLRR
jgi:SET domain